ncbi:hypothetical protein AEB_P1203 [Altererythrobacter sp. B11]|uniref:hypothetical protein n=1 Tax=Altererythrobacter sp. B11 TaxID=2060312 RepID=UPI000DC6D1C3|nr:hypothetical protein [Altererythrobacter sp. B11]BBC72071.1 hypothetical protein AEB_P1203 [Altererythrobacter sp. B11]
MAEEAKNATQSMPKDGLKGAPDGVNSQAEWGGTGGSDAGAPHPGSRTGSSSGKGTAFAQGALSHGGQSTIGYHGGGQLGDQEVRPGGNKNAGTEKG